MINTQFDDLFNDLVGQKTAISLLKATLVKGHIAPAYLFSGPNGIGRKLAAMRFLEGVLAKDNLTKSNRSRLENLNHPDLMMVEPSYLFQGNIIPRSIANEAKINRKSPPQIRLDQIRDVTRFLAKKPIESRLGMVLIDEVETMNEASSNALLKTLEEPHNGVLILISSRPDQLLDTIQSRCQTIPFRPLSKRITPKPAVKTTTVSPKVS